MCGIVYCAGLQGQPVNKLVINQFMAQRTRGIEGFGFYDNDTGRIHRTTKERKAISLLRRRKSSDILFHHRFPTSTQNVKNACHPFTTGDYFDKKYVLVHNGWITNDKTLKYDHEQLGIVYKSTQPDGTFNDSEALLWDFALYMEGKQTELKARGAIAFIALEKGDGIDKMHFGRNTNPLNIYLDKEVLMLSSEGKGTPIQSDTLYTYDYITGKVEDKHLEIPDYYTYTGSSYTYKGYDSGYVYEEEDDDELLAYYTAGSYFKAPSGRYVNYLYSDDEYGEEEMAIDIKETMKEYASLYDGVYERVFNSITQDLFDISQHLKEINPEEYYYSYETDLRYTMAILQACTEMLLEDKNWKNEYSVMPQYQIKQNELKLFGFREDK